MNFSKDKLKYYLKNKWTKKHSAGLRDLQDHIYKRHAVTGKMRATNIKEKV